VQDTGFKQDNAHDKHSEPTKHGNEADKHVKWVKAIQHLSSPSIAWRVHLHTLDCLRVLSLPASTIRANAESYVSALNPGCGEDLIARIDDPVVPAEAAMIAFCILIKP